MVLRAHGSVLVWKLRTLSGSGDRGLFHFDCEGSYTKYGLKLIDERSTLAHQCDSEQCPLLVLQGHCGDGTGSPETRFHHAAGAQPTLRLLGKRHSDLFVPLLHNGFDDCILTLTLGPRKQTAKSPVNSKDMDKDQTRTLNLAPNVNLTLTLTPALTLIPALTLTLTQALTLISALDLILTLTPALTSI
ncbi:Rna Exonuclease 1-like [Manis pentadactyla]|nr:Rna Exonuclease 1-like [Manis pentadactyla]